MTEKEIYPQIVQWLSKYLKSHYKKSKIIVKDTHTIALSKFLKVIGMDKKFPEYTAYDIKVDVTGVISSFNKTHLVFVECKINFIKLLDVGQLLGYSLVAKPIFSFLVSPKGISDSLHNLLKIYGRYDILKYDKERSIKIAKWDINKKEPLWDSLLPPGEYISKF
jgi:hypothetical protein